MASDADSTISRTSSIMLDGHHDDADGGSNRSISRDAPCPIVRGSSAATHRAGAKMHASRSGHRYPWLGVSDVNWCAFKAPVLVHRCERSLNSDAEDAITGSSCSSAMMTYNLTTARAGVNTKGCKQNCPPGYNLQLILRSSLLPEKIAYLPMHIEGDA